MQQSTDHPLSIMLQDLVGFGVSPTDFRYASLSENDGEPATVMPIFTTEPAKPLTFSDLSDIFITEIYTHDVADPRAGTPGTDLPGIDSLADTFVFTPPDTALSGTAAGIAPVAPHDTGPDATEEPGTGGTYTEPVPQARPFPIDREPGDWWSNLPAEATPDIPPVVVDPPAVEDPPTTPEPDPVGDPGGGVTPPLVTIMDGDPPPAGLVTIMDGDPPTTGTSEIMDGDPAPNGINVVMDGDPPTTGVSEIMDHDLMTLLVPTDDFLF